MKRSSICPHFFCKRLMHSVTYSRGGSFNIQPRNTYLSHKNSTKGVSKKQFALASVRQQLRVCAFASDLPPPQRPPQPQAPPRHVQAQAHTTTPTRQAQTAGTSTITIILVNNTADAHKAKVLFAMSRGAPLGIVAMMKNPFLLRQHGKFNDKASLLDERKLASITWGRDDTTMGCQVLGDSSGTRYSMDCGSDLPQTPPPSQRSEWILDRTPTNPPPPRGTWSANPKITEHSKPL